ncbi:ABC transporter ATP-binding protein [Paramaledivibacter caminithermalis]|jgi:peptide/nickel transport system ATP-binding protein|uniref:Peptide/nickel transport system ATP-binding protein n=1 Tax=Paramaledivibacter caminithermalis (strain DSM 15212 / CIP 107654 / DViRD3) TaxID=1121301 RepID=A0A1M6QPL9_PARC5|nr:ABC transporter ATP-binding protein [Paramaledivibacter caminithermalis]SHK22201.1 peptide/nickel transport system ATP-binding protein [Paramaledivibacter caminithermalis DSM 15212]
MKKELLKVKDLKISYFLDSEVKEAVKGVSFTLYEGETIGIIGESGSGKTSIAMSIMGLLTNAKIEGKIIYDGIKFNTLRQKELNRYRWNEVAIVFQNRLDVLNPVLTIREQIEEVLKKHTMKSKGDIKKRVKELFSMVNLEEKWLSSYAHELSGGMRQKVLIAMALSCNPKLLIIDEPTSSLDVLSKREIINLLKSIQKKNNISMLVISHELPVIQELTTKVEVLYLGHILEEGLTRDLINNPMHVYTRGLINSSCDINVYKELWGISPKINLKSGNGCPFYQRCVQASKECTQKLPRLSYISIERKVACNKGGIVTILETKDLSKAFKSHGSKIYACKNVSINVKAGEVAALIGASGSGKTTTAKIISGFLKSDSGSIYFEGKEIHGCEAMRKIHGIQIIFQDPFSAINGDFTVEKAVKEPLEILNIGSEEERKAMVKKALQDVQMPFDNEGLDIRCNTLSGGERQRISIARSLVMKPKLLIADEITSMLDPSTKANILRLLKGLQNEKGFSMLFITHDLPLARKIADKVYVMNRGSIVEEGNALEIFNKPKCQYTKKLFKECFHMTV